MSRPPYVVTGIGVAAPTGVGAKDHWTATMRGESALRPLPCAGSSDTGARCGGQIEHLDPAQLLPSRLMVQTDRATQLALIAAAEALDDAEVDLRHHTSDTAGVVTAVAGPGAQFHQGVLDDLFRRSSRHVSAYEPFAWFYPAAAGQISIRHGLRGPSATIVGEQAGLDAVAKACGELRTGATLMLAGAVDGSLCSWSLACRRGSGRLSEQADPRRCYLPFDQRACGHAPGEGGALLVIEPQRDGQRPVYGVIAGYATAFDPRPGSGREPGLRRTIEAALQDAGTTPAAIDVVFADAAGMPDLDRAEAQTLAAVFGPRAVPVTAPKTMTGHLLAGGSALDLATALLSMRHRAIPPTVNVKEPAYDDLIDLVRSPRETTIDYALVVARGYGGFNSAVVLRRTGQA
jgi:act minimal PKS chain-length factor (CLF/KS beta)